MIQQASTDAGIHGDKVFKVTVRTPSMISHEFEIHSNELVSHVIRESVAYFVAHRQLQPGKYDLALVRDGRAIELADAGRLEDYGVKPEDDLALIPEEAQVDG